MRIVASGTKIAQTFMYVPFVQRREFREKRRRVKKMKMSKKQMTKARLVKRQELIDREKVKAETKPPQPVIKKKVNAVVEWLETQKVEREDPRKKFAALFVQPQTN
jgi:hypothetical protein